MGARTEARACWPTLAPPPSLPCHCVPVRQGPLYVGPGVDLARPAHVADIRVAISRHISNQAHAVGTTRLTRGEPR
eukprot:5003865-Prymnesium_polylepis.1